MTNGKKSSYDGYSVLNDYFLIRTTSTISFGFKNFRWDPCAWIDGGFEKRMEFFCNFKVAHKESLDYIGQLILNELKNPELEDRPYQKHWDYREIIVHTDNESHSRKLPVLRERQREIWNYGEIRTWRGWISSIDYWKKDFFKNEIRENESTEVIINGIVHDDERQVFAICVNSMQDYFKGAVFTIWNTDNHYRNQFLEVLNISDITDSLRKRLLLHRDKDKKNGRYLNPQYRFEPIEQETVEETRIRQLPCLLEFLNLAKERKRPDISKTIEDNVPNKKPPRFFSTPPVDNSFGKVKLKN